MYTSHSFGSVQIREGTMQQQYRGTMTASNTASSNRAAKGQHDFRTSPLDSRGNFVAHHNTLPSDVEFTFEGRNNRVVIDGSVMLSGLKARFLGDNGQLVIGSSNKNLNIEVIVAESANIVIGENVTTEGVLNIATVPEAQVSVGSDCYFRTDVWIDADSEASFGGASKNAVTVENQVLVTGSDVQLRAGSHIGTGSILEMTPLIDEEIPAGSLVRGIPATIVRKAQWSRNNLPRI